MGGPRTTNADRSRVCRAVLIDDLPIDRARHLHPLAKEGVSYAWAKAKEMVEWFDSLTPEEAPEVLTDEGLRSLHQRTYGIPRDLAADVTELQQELDPDPIESQSREISAGCLRKVEQLASLMWVPSPNDVVLNPMLYGEGLFEVDIEGNCLRWKQSPSRIPLTRDDFHPNTRLNNEMCSQLTKRELFAITISLAWVDDNSENWLLREYLPLLDDKEGNELRILWQELQRDMCRYLVAGQMYYIAMNDGWGEATFSQTQQALLSDPNSVRGDTRFDTARFLLTEYPVLNGKVSQFKDRLQGSAMRLA